jgi:hypothetical protein
MQPSTFSQILTCTQAVWSPGIGDPNIMGWITVAAYIACALASLFLWVRNPFHGPGAWRERLFWGGVCVLMACLAVNKQLDLQTLMTAIGRCHAQLNGWYNDRQVMQRGFIRALALAAFLFALGTAWFLRASLRRNILAVLGLAFVLGFVVIRAVGFHDVDHLISAEVMSIRVNWILELSGLILILLNALPRCRCVASLN